MAGRPLGLIATATPAALPGLARKLPHYGKYGYLAFTGNEPEQPPQGAMASGGVPASGLVHDGQAVPAPVAAPALDAGAAGAQTAVRVSGTPSAPVSGTASVLIPVTAPLSPSAAGTSDRAAGTALMSRLFVTRGLSVNR